MCSFLEVLIVIFCFVGEGSYRFEHAHNAIAFKGCISLRRIQTEDNYDAIYSKLTIDAHTLLLSRLVLSLNIILNLSNVATTNEKQDQNAVVFYPKRETAEMDHPGRKIKIYEVYVARELVSELLFIEIEFC